MTKSLALWLLLLCAACTATTRHTTHSPQVRSAVGVADVRYLLPAPRSCQTTSIRRAANETDEGYVERLLQASLDTLYCDESNSLQYALRAAEVVTQTRVCNAHVRRLRILLECMFDFDEMMPGRYRVERPDLQAAIADVDRTCANVLTRWRLP